MTILVLNYDAVLSCVAYAESIPSVNFEVNGGQSVLVVQEILWLARIYLGQLRLPDSVLVGHIVGRNRCSFHLPLFAKPELARESETSESE